MTTDAVVERFDAGARDVKNVLKNVAVLDDASSDIAAERRAGAESEAIDTAVGAPGPFANAIKAVAHQGPRTALAVSYAVRRFAADPGWSNHPVVHELLEETIKLHEHAALDPDGEDPNWEIRAIIGQIEDLLATLRREIAHERLEDPASAARFVLRELESVDQKAVADLLGCDARTIRSWKSGDTSTIRKNPERIVLVGQLIFDLRNAMTAHGILAWFNRPRHQLGDRPPVELLSDPVSARQPLRNLARGIRGQLAT
jgi:hypothetical protein